MFRHQLSAEKANYLRQKFIDGEYNTYSLAKRLKVSTKTTWRYRREFEDVQLKFPDKLTDFGFYIKNPGPRHFHTTKYEQFELIMPVLFSQETAALNTRKMWEKYRLYSTDSYTF